MNIVSLGAPAAGKGTQAERLAEEFNLYYFQTGKIARKLSEENPRIKEIVDSGQLIPEEEMTMHVIDYLKDHHGEMSDILFEGFPRFISQYEALKNFLAAKGDDIDAVVSLDISQEEAIKRLSSRRICDKCGEIYNLLTNPPEIENRCKCGGELIQRGDDNPESIKVRFEFYRDNTKKLIEYLDAQGVLKRINAERGIDEIYNDLREYIRTIR